MNTSNQRSGQFIHLLTNQFSKEKILRAAKFKMHPYCQAVYLIKTCSMAGFMLLFWKISTCAVGFGPVISITFSPPALLKTQRSQSFILHLPLKGRQRGNYLSLRSLRLCGECTIFMEQQNRNLSAQVERFSGARFHARWCGEAHPQHQFWLFVAYQIPIPGKLNHINQYINTRALCPSSPVPRPRWPKKMVLLWPYLSNPYDIRGMVSKRYWPRFEISLTIYPISIYFSLIHLDIDSKIIFIAQKRWTDTGCWFLDAGQNKGFYCQSRI